MKKDKNGTIMDELMDSKEAATIPKVGDLIKAKVLSVGKNEVYLDIDGLTTGLVRGRELADGPNQIPDLKVGDEVIATVLDQENEKGLLELSFRSAGHQKTWQDLQKIKDNKETVEVKVKEANKGGLLVSLNQSVGFLPVSQLSKEHYPRVEGGNKSKILEKLKSLVGQTLKAKIIDLNEEEDKIIFSEKEVYAQDKKEQLKKYKIGDVVEGTIVGLVDFGVFIEFDQSLEGLIHISELAWRRIDHPRDLFKVGDKIKAQIIGIENERVTLSAKNLVEDPWKKAVLKYQVGQIVKGKVTKTDNFGAFVELDQDIHGLVHISELSDKKIDKPDEVVKVGESYDFKIVSIEPEDHRLGLSMKAVKENQK